MWDASVANGGLTCHHVFISACPPASFGVSSLKGPPEFWCTSLKFRLNFNVVLSLPISRFDHQANSRSLGFDLLICAMGVVHSTYFRESLKQSKLTGSTRQRLIRYATVGKLGHPVSLVDESGESSSTKVGFSGRGGRGTACFCWCVGCCLVPSPLPPSPWPSFWAAGFCVL